MIATSNLAWIIPVTLSVGACVGFMLAAFAFAAHDADLYSNKLHANIDKKNKV